MLVIPKKKLAIVLIAVALVGSTGAFAAFSLAEQPNDDQKTTYLRVAHASPDAPPVDVQIENETVLSNVSFGTVSDYLSLRAGTYNVTISASDDPDAVVFEDEVTLDPRSVTTMAASGEISDDAETSFEPEFYADNAFKPSTDASAIRVVHLSPDAPTVDVTVANGLVVVADNVSYQDASDYVSIPAGEYTLEIRAATDTDDGPVVSTVDVALEGGTAHSALALGYLNPDDAPADTPFQVVSTEDATTTIQMPSDDEVPTETPTMTETPNATEEPTETETPTMTETPNATEEPTATETPNATEEPTATETAATETLTATQTPSATEESTETPTEVATPTEG